MALTFSESEVQEQLRDVAGWTLENGAIVRTFDFDSFSHAIDFVCDVADAAEEANHHPDIDIRYNKVHLALVSHDAGGITGRDISMARTINELT